ncbi:MAG: MFS transporter [Gammaproteobacteria bacterium]|nr:MFS transporter [Gammaproteobacteria bacterium]
MFFGARDVAVVGLFVDPEGALPGSEVTQVHDAAQPPDDTVEPGQDVPPRAVSILGTWMQTVGASWLVYRLTGSAFLLGLVAAAQQLPMLFLAPVAGVWADRVDRRKLLIATQALTLLQAATLTALTFTDIVTPAHVVLVSLALGLINAVETPTRQAFLLEMVDSKQDLPNAIALQSMMFNSARSWVRPSRASSSPVSAKRGVSPSTPCPTSRFSSHTCDCGSNPARPGRARAAPRRARGRIPLGVRPDAGAAAHPARGGDLVLQRALATAHADRRGRAVWRRFAHVRISHRRGGCRRALRNALPRIPELGERARQDDLRRQPRGGHRPDAVRSRTRAMACAAVPPGAGIRRDRGRRLDQHHPADDRGRGQASTHHQHLRDDLPRHEPDRKFPRGNARRVGGRAVDAGRLRPAADPGGRGVHTRIRELAAGHAPRLRAPGRDFRSRRLTLRIELRESLLVRLGGKRHFASDQPFEQDELGVGVVLHRRPGDHALAGCVHVAWLVVMRRLDRLDVSRIGVRLDVGDAVTGADVAPRRFAFHVETGATDSDRGGAGDHLLRSAALEYGEHRPGDDAKSAENGRAGGPREPEMRVLPHQEGVLVHHEHELGAPPGHDHVARLEGHLFRRGPVVHEHGALDPVHTRLHAAERERLLDHPQRRHGRRGQQCSLEQPPAVHGADCRA